MNTTDRNSNILAAARRNGKVNATVLADTFGMAVQIIQRDLTNLCSDGLLERVHGGAILPSGVRNIGYDDRRALGRDAKLRIGARTAAIIPDNASIFLNIGTTTEAVAHAISAHCDLMVVTNNLNIANILARNPTCEVVVAGGTLRRTDGGLVGDLAALVIAQFKVDIAVIGASAIDPSGDLLDFDPQEVRVSRQILDAARASILVADKSKFKRKAPVRIGSVAEVGDFVTDEVTSERFVNACADWQTRLHLV